MIEALRRIPLRRFADERGFAFNLADVFFLAGNLLLMTALVVMVVGRRDRLAPPRPWERALLRQLHVGG